MTSDEGGDPACWSHLIPESPAAVVVSLGGVLSEVGNGVHWSLEPDGDLNANLVRLDAMQEIPKHQNDELDVMIVVLDGRGHIRVDDVRRTLSPNVVALVPSCVPRSIHAGPAGLWYLTVHRRSGPLRIG